MNSRPVQSLPVHVLTGFLGAGKTTLLNRLIRSGGFANTAVIINEFGDVGIDHLLVEAAEGAEPMIELSDGCLCCTVRSDLVDTLFQIAERIDAGAALDRVVIETTGLADPAPVLQAIIATPGLNERFHVASVVTVVCAATGLASLEGHEEARKQVALADRIVLTKTDIAPPTDALRARMSALNPLVAPVDARAADFVLALDDAALTAADVPAEAHSHDHHHHDVNRHDASIEAFTLTHDRPIPSATVEMFIDLLRSSMPRELLRMKGVVETVERPPAGAARQLGRAEARDAARRHRQERQSRSYRGPVRRLYRPDRPGPAGRAGADRQSAGDSGYVTRKRPAMTGRLTLTASPVQAAPARPTPLRRTV